MSATPSRNAAESPTSASFLSGLREFVMVAVIALTLSFLVKTFLFQAFFIPSDSMEDTLIRGDRIIVSKLTPGPSELSRGDVVVFSDPGGWLGPMEPQDRGPVLNGIRSTLTFVGLVPDTSEGHLIKRVIGLPGDRVQCCDASGRLTINGTGITEPYVKAGQQPSGKAFDITVPAGKVWLMGDNRGDSADSRAHDLPLDNGSNGSVPESLIVGRASVILWPLDRIGWLSNYSDTFQKVPAPSRS